MNCDNLLKEICGNKMVMVDLTLTQKMSERGKVTRMRRALRPVRRRAHGPGLVGSATEKTQYMFKSVNLFPPT